MIYIDEKTTAKYLNITNCVKSIQKMYKIMQTKDYAMGGKNANSHGMRISIPRDKHTNNLKGRTRNYLPVQIISDSEDIYNSLQNVTLTKFENGNIYGEIN